MRQVCAWKCFFLLITALLTSCRHAPETESGGAFHFEEGISTLAKNLGDQLDEATVGNMLNKAVGTALSKVKGVSDAVQGKKITVDPLVDAESGYPLKANGAIVRLLAEELEGRYRVTGEMLQENLEESDYVLTGYVTYQRREAGAGAYQVVATVFEKNSGQLMASASVLIDRFDTTPLRIYAESPVFLKGRNYAEEISVARKAPGTSTTRSYLKRLKAKAVQVKADLSYENQHYKESLAGYNELAQRMDEPELEVLNGLFTNLVKQGKLQAAEKLYRELLRLCITQSGSVSSKIFFAPNSVVPLESGSALYKIYMRQMAHLLAEEPATCIQIVGHCSRSGSEELNEQLSLQRARWVHEQMADYAPASKNRAETVGRGYRDNMVGSGADDITDAVDRRVEFKLVPCGAAPDAGTEAADDEKPKRPPNRPLHLEDIEFFLQNKVSSKVIAMKVAERGVSFQLDDQTIRRLRKSKADDRLFRAINRANSAKQGRQ